MGKPYSMDLGERVVSALKGQRRPAELIKCVHSNQMRKWRRRIDLG